MKKTLLPLLLVLLLCIPLIGCDSEEGMAAEEIEQIVQEVVANQSDTCTFDMDICHVMEIKDGNRSVEVNFNNWSEGAIDSSNETFYMHTTENYVMPGCSNETRRIETYILADQVYLKEGIKWTNMVLTPEIWEEEIHSLQLTDILSSAEIDYEDSEAINGIDCYKFNVAPDIGQMTEYLGLEELKMDALGIFVTEEMMSLKSTFWIAKEGSQIMKIYLNLTLELSSDDLPEYVITDFNKVSEDSTFNIIFDYSQPVSIELPDEALESEEESLS